MSSTKGRTRPILAYQKVISVREKLWQAVSRRDFPGLQAALDEGASVNAMDPKGQYWSPLHYAVAWDDTKLVRVLLEAGADESLRDGNGKSVSECARAKNGAAAAFFSKNDVVVEEEPQEPYPFLALLPQAWRMMKEVEDRYRVLFVQPQGSVMVLENPFLLLVNLFQQQPKAVVSSVEEVPVIFDTWRAPAWAGEACVVNQEAFFQHWEIFTGGLLRDDFDYSNVFCAGGAILACVVPISTGVEGKRARIATFYREESEFRGSDIDLFIYGLDPGQATEKVRQILGYFKKNFDDCLFVRMENCITIVVGQARHVQIILRCYRTPAEILMGFDIDCCCVGFDGKNVYALPRAVRSLQHRLNLVDPSRQSKSYCLRLVKYAKRGFAVGVPGLDRTLVNAGIFAKHPRELVGLAKLLVVEALICQGLPSTVIGGCLCRRRPVRNLMESLSGRLCNLHRAGESIVKTNVRMRQVAVDIENDDALVEFEQYGPLASDYSSVFIPYGPRWTADKIASLLETREIWMRANGLNRAFVYSRQSVKEIVCTEEAEDVSIAASLSDAWMVDNPGTQLTGSFHPTSEDDFWKGAFTRVVRKDLLVDVISCTYENPSSASKALICRCCNKILCDARRVRCCEEHACLECLTQFVGQRACCPFCKQRLDITMGLDSPEKAVVKLLNELQVQCQYAAAGCKWKGARGDLEEHMRGVCLFAKIQCPLAAKGCRHVGERRGMEHHLQHTCAAQKAQQQRLRALKVNALIDEVILDKDDLVDLSVGGTLFTTSRQTLSRCEGSLLAAVAERIPRPCIDPVFLDRPGDVFGWMLAWLQTRVLPATMSEGDRERLMAEAEFWHVREMLEQTTSVVHCLPSQPRQEASVGSVIVSTHCTASNAPCEDTYGVWEVGGEDLLCGVFDGHGGRMVSEYLKDNMCRAMAEERELRDAIRRCDVEWLELVRSIPDEKERSDAVVQGSCALLVNLNKNSRKVTCAHVGDCSAVLGSLDGGGSFLLARRVHRAREPGEQKVMREEWGLGDKDSELFQLQTVNGETNVYVKGVLQVTRVVGDLYLRHEEFMNLTNIFVDEAEKLHWVCGPYVRCEPEVFEMQLEGKSGFVILGSDGLWDQIGQDFACELVRRLDNAERVNAARHLVEAALTKAASRKGKTVEEVLRIAVGGKRDIYDDITCVVVFF